MSCGLGAVILVLILLKSQPEETPVEIEPLNEQLAQLKSEEAEILASIADQEAKNQQLDTVRADIKAKQAALAVAIATAESDTEEKKQRRLVHIPVGRFGQAKEMAEAALFLASDESKFVTGTDFKVDGGITAAYVTPE